MGNYEVKELKNPTTPKVGDAVGVDSRRWLVARVSNNAEKSSRDTLLRKGINAFAATQKEIHDWKGKKHEVEVVRISTYLFVYVNRDERNEIIHYPFIKSFLVDRTTTTRADGLRSDVVIPENEIERLRYMLHQCETPVEFVPGSFSKGDYVRVCRGGMQGVVGQLVNVDHTGTKRFGVNISCLGCATMQVPASELEKITEQEYNDYNANYTSNTFN